MSLVLIIDNDEQTLFDLQQAFENIGYQTISTTNSLGAMPLFCKHKPTIVILDLFMREKDGFELTKEIRKYSQNSLIVATSFEERYLRMIKALGANAAFPKPLKTEVFAQNVYDLQQYHDQLSAA